MNAPGRADEGRTRRSMDRMRRIYYFASPVPLALYVALDWDISRLEAMGQFAAAPVLFGPVLLSFLLALLGAVLLAFAWRAGGPRFGLFVATGVAGSLGMWFLLRVLLR